MKTFLWFVLGVAGGFVAAHLVDKDPRGHELLAEIDARISAFADRMSDAYRDQEARFSTVAVGAASDSPPPSTSATAPSSVPAQPAEGVSDAERID